MEFWMVVVGVIVILLLLYITIYNKFRRLVVEVEETSSGIDVALAKRYDLITNLVETVKGYAKHEKDVFERVAQIRNLLKDSRNEANEEMNSSLGRIFSIVESYPELKANEQFLALQASLVDVEEHLQAARRLYNRRVAELNVKVNQFPTNLIAGSMNVGTKPFFAANDEQRESVKVTL